MGSIKDITGQRYGKLVAVEPTERREGSNVIWCFKCDCGRIIEKSTKHLSDKSSCGMGNCSARRKDITGQRYGRLTAIKPTDDLLYGSVVWEFKCDCGNTIFVPIHYVTSGKTSSCGCLRREITAQKCYVDLIGRRFGMLEVIGQTGHAKDGGLLWNCLCDCGNTVQYTANALNSGSKLNCGCNPKYKFYCVYKHVFPDGRVYVGKTSKMPILRWYSNYKQQTAVRQVIEAIGESWIDSIEHYYLSSSGEWVQWNRDLDFKTTNIFSISGASRWEKEWIKRYDSNNPEFGLNSTTGGDKGFTFNEDARRRNAEAQPDKSGENSPWFGKKHSEETKAKQSEAARRRIDRIGVNFKGQHHTEETKAVLRRKALERDAHGIKPFKGKHHSEESKAKNAAAKIKAVTQYDLQGKKIATYKSLKAAASALNVSVSAISSCVCKKTNNCKGYIWRNIDMNQLPMSEMPNSIHGLSKRVHQLDLNGNFIAEYASLKEAAATVNRTVTSLSAALKKGDNATCGGYKWKFADNNTVHGTTKTVKQYDLEGNELVVYNSVKEAAEATGIDKKSISAAATGKLNTAGGFIWEY